MTDKIDAAITALRARDATAYRAARAAFFRAEDAYKAASTEIADAGRADYRRIELHFIAALKPHRIEWRWSNPPSTRETHSGDVNHAEWTCSVGLTGEIWPAIKGPGYRMQMRTHIPFSMEPRNGDEFRSMLALLKAAADAMRDGGL